MMLSFNIQAVELSLGYGESYRSDASHGPLYSITVGSNGWKYCITRWDQYTRTPWYGKHPEWGSIVVKSHHMFSITKEVYQYDLSNDFNFFIDLGLAYSDKISRVNSSSVIFKEAIGLEYKNIKLSFTHTSNAGIEPPNTGEDAILVEYSF